MLQQVLPLTHWPQNSKSLSSSERAAWSGGRTGSMRGSIMKGFSHVGAAETDRGRARDTATEKEVNFIANEVKGKIG